MRHLLYVLPVLLTGCEALNQVRDGVAGFVASPEGQQALEAAKESGARVAEGVATGNPVAVVGGITTGLAALGFGIYKFVTRKK